MTRSRTARTLDSSEVLISENVRVEVREVALMRSQSRFASLEQALSYASNIGYFLFQISLINVVHGETKKNEPRPVLTLRHKGNSVSVDESIGDALIVEDTFHDATYGPRYCFYVFGDGFNYIP